MSYYNPMPYYNIISKIAIGMFIASALLVILFVGGFILLINVMGEGPITLTPKEKLSALNEAAAEKNLNLTFSLADEKSLKGKSAILGIYHLPYKSPERIYTEIYIDDLASPPYGDEEPDKLVMFQTGSLLALPEDILHSRYHHISSGITNTVQVRSTNTEIPFGNIVERTPETQDAMYVILLPHNMTMGHTKTEEFYAMEKSAYVRFLDTISKRVDLSAYAAASP